MYAVGKDKAVNFAEKLGLDFQKPVYDPVAIGSYEPGATPLQMAGAYAAFGNKGVYNEPYTVTKIVFPDGKTIKPKHLSHTAMHDYTAYMVTDVLKSVIEYGTGKSIQLPGLPVAGKTGSVGLSDEFRAKHGIIDTGGYSDEWFTGYTTQYTASIWTGYPSLTKDGKVHYMSSIESKNIAKEIFEKLMADISDENVPDFEKPDSVVDIGGGELAVRGEQSTSTSEPSENSQQQKTEEPKKQSPTPQNPEPKPEKPDETDSGRNADHNSRIEKPKDSKKDDENQQNQSQENKQKEDKQHSGSDHKNGKGNENHGNSSGTGQENGNSGNNNGDGQGNGNSGNDNGNGQGSGDSDDKNGNGDGDGNSGADSGNDPGNGNSDDSSGKGQENGGSGSNNGKRNENHNGGNENHQKHAPPGSTGDKNSGNPNGN
jgi:penicillin-binding protein 1A